MQRIHAFVSGMVQGVFFRANTSQFAARRGITGWVRNLVDGRVEVVAEGEDGKIEELAEFLRSGPPGSKVGSAEIRKEPYKGEFSRFSIIYI